MEEQNNIEKQIRKAKIIRLILLFSIVVVIVMIGIRAHCIYNEKMAEEVTQNIYDHMSADNKLSLDDFEKEYWKIVENKEYCLNNKCFYGAKGKKKTLYIYDCQEKKYDEIDLKIYYDELNSKYELEVACTLMNNNGFYKNADETISCSNYTCRWSRNGRLYYKNCKDK